MNDEYWIKKWESGDTKFHKQDVHPALTKYVELLPQGTVLVPLCGKSLDMIFLASKGLSVIGVELSLLACRAFFNENHIPYMEKVVDDFTVLESEQITLWCGNFFNLPDQVWSQIASIYDRAALVALPEEMRVSYASQIGLKGNKLSTILLVTYEYPHGIIEGPPFSIPKVEVERLYRKFSLEQKQVHHLSEYKNHPTLGKVELVEAVYLLQPTSAE